MKERKIPVRTCIACRTPRPKKELLRIVKNKEGEVSCDFVGKASGRGAYICPNIQCLEKAYKIITARQLFHNRSEITVYAKKI